MGRVDRSPNYDLGSASRLALGAPLGGPSMDSDADLDAVVVGLPYEFDRHGNFVHESGRRRSAACNHVF
jgi:hypothetical protein